MKRIVYAAAFLIAVSLCGILTASGGPELKAIVLPKPHTRGGMPLMKALKKRKSSRVFGAKELTPRTASNLLWAAFGINRPESGKRTAPSAGNRREIDIYAATERGLYLYNPAANTLEPVLSKDLRGAAGKQPFVRTAPLVLIYVADYSRMGDAPTDKKDFYSATDTGFISQNVYLFCASEGLSTVVLGMVDRPALAKAMGLKNDRKIVLTQPVGYPK